jgi:HEAT repeat protein
MLNPSLDQASKDKLTEVLDTYLLDNKSAERHTTPETKYAAIFALRSTGGEAALRVLERLSKDPDPTIARLARDAAYSFE